jgi:Flp pilus assembly protein TadD
MIVPVVLATMALTATELYQEGSTLFQKGRLTDAAARFEQARQLAPNDARIAKALGVSHAALGDYERANEPLERACTLDAKLPDACYFYGRNLYALNRFGPALTVLKKTLRSDSRPWRVHLAIAQALEGLGRGDDAESDYRKAVSMFESLPPNERGRPDFDPRVHYATYLYRQARLPDALRLAEQVTAAWPDYGRGHFEVGRILHQQGNLEKAAAALEKAVEGKHGAPAHLLLARVYLRLGQPDRAQQHLILGNDPASAR